MSDSRVLRQRKVVNYNENVESEEQMLNSKVASPLKGRPLAGRGKENAKENKKSR